MHDNSALPQGLLISVVVPAYNEAGNLSKLCAELQRVLLSLDLGWEIVLVDDGSTDGTWRDIESLHKKDSRLHGIRLSRNFGHQNALIAGLAHACGNAVISMDADLQHPPDVIPLLVAEWRKGNKIVKTVRRDSENLSAFKRWTSRLYYRVFSFLSGVELQSGMADFRLIDRQVLNELLEFREEGLFLRGLIQWVGYPSTNVVFDCGTRYSGTTKYTLRKMLRFAWNGITSFSVVPLRIAILIGVGSSAAAFVGVLYAILEKLFGGHTVPGWASTLAITSFLFGVLFLFLAILGEYVGRILVEVRGRPRFMVSEQVGVRTVAADNSGANMNSYTRHA